MPLARVGASQLTDMLVALSTPSTGEDRPAGAAPHVRPRPKGPTVDPSALNASMRYSYSVNALSPVSSACELLPSYT